MALAVSDLPEPEPVPSLSDLLGLSRPGWQARAACRALGPDDWFPERGAAQAPALRRAREICGGCPVRQECTEFAGADPHGLWGGLSVEQRKRRRRARTAAAESGPGAAPAAPQRSAGPALPAAHPRRSGTSLLGGAGGPATVPMVSAIFDPDTRTIEQWRASPAGRSPTNGRGDLTGILAELERAFGRSRPARS